MMIMRRAPNIVCGDDLHDRAMLIPRTTTKGRM